MHACILATILFIDALLSGTSLNSSQQPHGHASAQVEALYGDEPNMCRPEEYEHPPTKDQLVCVTCNKRFAGSILPTQTPKHSRTQ